jgi:hypothetical protein
VIALLATLGDVCDPDPRYEVFRHFEVWLGGPAVAAQETFNPASADPALPTLAGLPEPLCPLLCPPSDWKKYNPSAEFLPGEAEDYAWATVLQLSAALEGPDAGTTYFVESVQWMSCDETACRERLTSVWRLDLDIAGQASLPVSVSATVKLMDWPAW